jgi:CRISPR system Cascade subunit CasD
MAPFLTLTYVAPLASFGAIAVGERRPSWDRPGKSAALGLLAGALGLDRSDEEAHRALAAGYLFAARAEDLPLRGSGHLTIDYHTAQSPPRMRNRRFATRREELAAENLGTILTRREYHADSCFTLAFWPRGVDSRWTLDELANALRRPAYVPFAGRKACPLMLPMDPRIIEADDVFEALARRDALIAANPRIADFLHRHHLDSRPHSVALDADAQGEHGPARIEKRRDALLDRGRWQFGLREEVVIAWPAADGAR